jgi:hypothetical protein
MTKRDKRAGSNRMSFARAGLFILYLGLLAQAAVHMHEGRENKTENIHPYATSSAPPCLGLYKYAFCCKYF